MQTNDAIKVLEKNVTTDTAPAVEQVKVRIKDLETRLTSVNQEVERLRQVCIAADTTLTTIHTRYCNSESMAPLVAEIEERCLSLRSAIGR